VLFAATQSLDPPDPAKADKRPQHPIGNGEVGIIHAEPDSLFKRRNTGRRLTEM